MGRPTKHPRREKPRKIRTQPPRQSQRRMPHHIASADQFDPMSTDDEFIHDDDWLYPYESEP